MEESVSQRETQRNLLASHEQWKGSIKESDRLAAFRCKDRFLKIRPDCGRYTGVGPNCHHCRRCRWTRPGHQPKTGSSKTAETRRETGIKRNGLPFFLSRKR